MDLVRRILLALEERENHAAPEPLDFVDEYPKNFVHHHVRLMSEAGLIEVHDFRGVGDGGNARCWPKSIKMEGYNFLDTARHDGVWASAKRRLAHLGGSTSLAVLKALLVQLAKEKLGLGVGGTGPSVQ